MPSQSIQFLSTAEYARILGISPVAVFKRIQSGKIKAAKIGRSYAIPRAYIEEGSARVFQQQQKALEYVSVMQAADILGVTRETVLDKIRTGVIKADKVGRHYIIEKEVLSGLIQSDRVAEVYVAKEYVSVPEAAEALGISRVAVFKKVKQGVIQAGKIGRRYVIHRSEITGTEERPGEEQYISVQEAAVRLGISRFSVFKKIQKGQLPARRVGRSYDVLLEHVDRVKRKR